MLQPVVQMEMGIQLASVLHPYKDCTASVVPDKVLAYYMRQSLDPSDIAHNSNSVAATIGI